MTGAFPDLRVHQDGAVQAGHFVSFRGSIENGYIVMLGNHVGPPAILDVSFQLNPERTVIPASVHSAVDLAGLEYETASF